MAALEEAMLKDQLNKMSIDKYGQPILDGFYNFAPA